MTHTHRLELARMRRATRKFLCHWDIYIIEFMVPRGANPTHKRIIHPASAMSDDAHLMYRAYQLFNTVMVLPRNQREQILYVTFIREIYLLYTVLYTCEIRAHNTPQSQIYSAMRVGEYKKTLLQ